MLQLASNRKPHLARTIGPIFPCNLLGRGVIFEILWTLISRKLLKISKNRWILVDVKLKDLQIWFRNFFRYLKRFLRYFGRTVFEKSLSGARGRQNVLTWVEIRLIYLSELEIESKCWTEQSGQYFSIIRDGRSFWDFWNPCISRTVGDIKMRLASKLKDLQRFCLCCRYL